MNYNEALQTIEKYNPKPIKIEFDDIGIFNGVQFNCKEQGPYCEELDEYLEGQNEETWLLVNCDGEEIDAFDKKFTGEDFDLYGETHGDDFIFMHKTEPTRCVEVEIMSDFTN